MQPLYSARTLSLVSSNSSPYDGDDDADLSVTEVTVVALLDRTTLATSCISGGMPASLVSDADHFFPTVASWQQ